MIKIQGLTKYYGKTKGIENLDLSIKEGEVFGLLGPNGAGKTTTIRMLMGLLKPTSGLATINGLDCWNDSEKVKEITGYIPGDVHLYPNETGNSMIKIFGGIRKNSKLSKDLIERFDFDPTKRIKSLSKGNRQKLAIILAFMFEPKVLILDEPTSGLDPLMQQKFYTLIKEFEKNGATFLVSSHYLPEIEKIGEKIGIVKDGSLIGIEDVQKMSSKHLRVINVSFKEKPDLKKYKIEQIVEIKHIFDNTFQMKIKGEVDPVIKALSKDSIVDLSLEHASLEEIFLEYYS